VTVDKPTTGADRLPLNYRLPPDAAPFSSKVLIIRMGTQ